MCHLALNILLNLRLLLLTRSQGSQVNDGLKYVPELVSGAASASLVYFGKTKHRRGEGGRLQDVQPLIFSVFVTAVVMPNLRILYFAAGSHSVAD